MNTDFDKYTTFLKDVFWQRITIGIVIGVVILVVMLILSITREEKLMWRIILICSEVILVFTTFFSVLPYGTDIYNGEYSVYEGEYAVQDIVAEKGRGFFAIISLEDNQTIKLCLKVCEEDPPIGHHNGRLLYSKNTRFLFAWE